MSFKCCQFVIILFVAIQLSTASREKRSDDRDPLEAVVEHLSQQVTALNSELAALKTKTGTCVCQLFKVAIKSNIRREKNGAISDLPFFLYAFDLKICSSLSWFNSSFQNEVPAQSESGIRLVSVQ